jgi:large subunit ribosomal protein L6
MSRIGKKPVVLPAGVTAKVDGQLVQVKGAKGQLEFLAPDDVSVVQQDNAITVDPRNETKRARALWGTARAQINNIVVGVTTGFEKKLEITGVAPRCREKRCNSRSAIRMT